MKFRNNILVSGNADSTVKMWDIRTGKLIRTLDDRQCKHEVSFMKFGLFENTFFPTKVGSDLAAIWRQVHCDVERRWNGKIVECRDGEAHSRFGLARVASKWGRGLED